MIGVPGLPRTARTPPSPVQPHRHCAGCGRRLPLTLDGRTPVHDAGFSGECQGSRQPGNLTAKLAKKVETVQQRALWQAGLLAVRLGEEYYAITAKSDWPAIGAVRFPISSSRTSPALCSRRFCCLFEDVTVTKDRAVV
jgi:hypothetical protein